MTGFSLKMIALSMMTVDHLAVALALTGTPYFLCRMAGRLAFPLYAFLLAEGIYHAKSLTKYCTRLLVFGLLAQAPYIYLFGIYKLNVLFLFAGCVLMVDGAYRPWHSPSDVLKLASGFILCACSEYGLLGSLLIICYYFLRDAPLWRFWLCVVFSGVLSSSYHYITAFTGPIINAYNGRQGRRMGRYWFYAYYPAHLLVLSLIKVVR